MTGISDETGRQDRVQMERVVEDPEPGDFVRLAGRVISINAGMALVEVYRSYPPGLRIPVQCGVLEHVEPAAEGPDGGGCER